jgi:predicted acylesterase/phospholipase RssA
MRIVFVFCSIIVLNQALTGCTSPKRLQAVPEAQQDMAEIPGLAGVRYRMGTIEDTQSLEQEALESIQREKAYNESQAMPKELAPANFLAISGGGDNGAYAAGFLNGWSKSGTRPEFKLVTGISTGGLIAPFAFLGEGFDDRLTAFYTQTDPEDIMRVRYLAAAIFSDSLADNAPLWKIIKKEVNQEFLDRVAAEYHKGRLLFLGTTDLDARKGIIWNMTKIASVEDPRALQLFQSIMIASAAVPGGFPPVMIDVEVEGEKFQEMHVDGGATAQVFVYPTSLKVDDIAKAYNIDRERNLYILRNARLDANWSSTERSLLSIAGKSISSLIHMQGMGDLARIYLLTRRDGVSYNLAFIPEDFEAEHKEEFDNSYMRALYKVGYDAALGGYEWSTTAPGFEGDRFN